MLVYGNKGILGLIFFKINLLGVSFDSIGCAVTVNVNIGQTWPVIDADFRVLFGVHVFDPKLAHQRAVPMKKYFVVILQVIGGLYNWTILILKHSDVVAVLEYLKKPQNNVEARLYLVSLINRVIEAHIFIGRGIILSEIEFLGHFRVRQEISFHNTITRIS